MFKAILAYIFVILMTGIASAGTIHNIDKGTDYTTIQAAIDDANTGDTIKVDSDIYYENININRQLIIQGNYSGNNKPIIDAVHGLYGIHITTNGVVIDGFVIINGGIGIYTQSDYNIIKNNTINNNIDYGIYIYPSSYNTIKNNIISNNDDYGIYGYQSSHNTIEDNIINNTIWYGIWMEVDSNGNKIVRNNINNNTWYGIMIADSSDNEIYNNIFNNSNNVGFSRNNNWSIAKKVTGTNIIGGKYLGGNFWANPYGTGYSQTCIDKNRDGICDLEYILDTNNIDYLPLSTKAKKRT